MKIIGQKGAKGFYEGEIARDMVKSLNNLGGTHTEEDFYNQFTIVSDTLISNYKENSNSSMPTKRAWSNSVQLMIKLLETLIGKISPF